MSNKVSNIGFIGLGKLGMDCAEVFAEEYTVFGYDVVERTSPSVKVQTKIDDVVNNADWLFIAVPTPHEAAYDGSIPSCHLPVKDFGYDDVKTVLTQINSIATTPKNIVLISTVLPGTTRKQLISQLDVQHTLIYNPYLIAMGTVKWDFANPEMVIIGSDHGQPADVAQLIEIYKPLMKNNPRYEGGTWEEAEGIKIFYNTFISAKVGLANMIQDFAIKIGHTNVDVITGALARSNMRIMGPKYMTAGMGDAGACHPRDNIALRWLAEEYEVGYDMFHTIMRAREVQAENLANFLVAEAVKANLDTVIIHGKAYKPDVEYTIGSYSTLVGHYVTQNSDCKLVYVDPLTNDNVDSVKGVVLLAHNRKITYGYAGIEDADPFYCKIEQGSVIVDPWRQQDDITGITVVHYGNTR
jgi:UDPglucose 6-dehydrogenase